MWVLEFEGHRSKAFDEDDLVEGEEEGEKEDVGEEAKRRRNGKERGSRKMCRPGEHLHCCQMCTG